MMLYQKNNLKKWSSLFGKFFGLSLFLSLSLLLLMTPVKASNTEIYMNLATPFNNYIEITSENKNDTLICKTKEFYTTQFGMTFGGVEMTFLHQIESYYQQYQSVYYLEDLTQFENGNYLFVNNGTYGYDYYFCYFTNIKFENNIVKTQANADTYVNGNIGNYLLIHVAGKDAVYPQEIGWTSSNFFDTAYNEGFFTWKYIESGTEWANVGSYNEAITYELSFPISLASISYTGYSVVEHNIYDDWQIPFSYDISSELYQSCSDIYVSLNSGNQMFDFLFPKLYLKGGYNLYPLIYSSFLTGSVDSWYLSGGLGFSSLPLSLDDVSVDLTCVDFEGNKTSYSSSETFDLTLVNKTFSFPDDYIESGVITGVLNVDYNSNLEGSLSVPLNYSLINYNYNLPYSDVCLKDIVTGMVDESTCKTLSFASGVIYLDTPDYACLPSRRFSFVYREENSLIPDTSIVVLETEPFIINYLNYPYCVPDFDEQDDFGVLGNWVYNSVGSFFSQVSKTFPFSLITLIDKSWRDSAYLDLEGSLSFLDITDESGDISVDIPLISTTSSSTNLVIFGSSIFENNSNMVTFFNNFRSFSTYLFYFLFFLALYRLAFRIYNILKVQ